MTNRGETTLGAKRRSRDPMRDYDALPPALRRWVAGAALPWSARSVRRAYGKARAKTGDEAAALAELDRLQARTVARDRAVWGGAYPR
ncbi:MAG: DUF6525 family protein [Shimia sp.]